MLIQKKTIMNVLKRKWMSEIKQHKRFSSNLAELRTSLLQKLPRPKNKFRMKIIEEYYKQIRSKHEVLFYTIKLKLNARFLVRKKTCQSLT